MTLTRILGIALGALIASRIEPSISFATLFVVILVGAYVWNRN